MKTIIKYECEICGNKSENAKEIIECENKGKQTPYPKGMIFESGFCGNKMVFCVIKSYREGHFYHYCTWACSDTDAEDNFGKKEYCGLNGWEKDIKSPNKNSNVYKRMKKGLLLKGIKPVDYKKGIV